MATIKNRIAVLEAKQQSMARQIIPELNADLRVAFDWWNANGCRYDLLPRDDMTEGERAALTMVLRFMAKFDEDY